MCSEKKEIKLFCYYMSMKNENVLFAAMVISLLVWIGSGILDSVMAKGSGELSWIGLFITGPAGIVCMLTVAANFILRSGRR